MSPTFEMMIMYRKLRGSNATRWADHLRLQGSAPSAAAKAMALLQQADHDSRICSSCLTNSGGPDHAILQREVWEVHSAALLSLSETEIDLGLLEQAHAHFRSAKRIISHLRDYSESLASSPRDISRL